MKKYKKGIKFFALLIIIISGTAFFIRKVDTMSEKIQESVKNNLEVEKTYSAVSNSIARDLNAEEKKVFSNLVSKTTPLDLNKILLIDHKFRLKDTLYSVQVFIDKKNTVYAVNKPIKVH